MAATIAASLVPVGNASATELVENGDFEDAMTAWKTSSQVTNQISSDANQTNYLDVSDRSFALPGRVSQDFVAVGATLVSGTQYRLRFRMKVAAPAAVHVRLSVRSSDGGSAWTIAERAIVVANEWTTVSGLVAPVWSGTLRHAVLSFDVDQPVKGDLVPRPSFSLDDVRMDVDEDGDWLSDDEETALSTDAEDVDSDLDGMPDGWEVDHGLDPTDVTDDVEDPDGDGFLNVDEWAAATDPNDIDSYPGKPSQTTTNAAALDVLAYLAARPAQGTTARVVSGQHINNPETSEFAALFTNPGNTASAPIGLLSMSYNKGGGATQIDYVNEKAIDHWDNGGLVMICWTPRNPWTVGGEPTSNRVKMSLGFIDDPDVALNELFQETDAHERFDGYLEEVATALLELQEEGVVVLFNPFPEVNSPRYWWGQRGRDSFVGLWRWTRDRFEGLGVTNVLWVYEANASVQESSGIPIDYYYPGNGYADIFAHTLISDIALARFDAQGIANAYPKVYGFSQVGPDDSFTGNWKTTALLTGTGAIGGVQYSYPRASFFVAGSVQPWVTPNYLSLGHNEQYVSLLNNAWVVNRGELGL